MQRRDSQPCQQPKAISQTTVSTATARDPRSVKSVYASLCFPCRRDQCPRGPHPLAAPKAGSPHPAPYLVPEEGRVQRAQEP